MKIFLKLIVASLTMAVLLSVGGCKAQQQMQQQLEALDTKLADSQKRITNLENELKKSNFETQQLKALVTKLGNVVVDMQKAEEERQKAAAAAAAKPSKGGKKKAAGHGAGKKH